MKLSKPTYDELFALVQHQSRIIFEQSQTIKRLEKKVAELEERLGLNSKNSSKPPSTDQKANQNPPRKGGANVGHPGHFRPLRVAHKVIEHKPKACSRCGSCNLCIGKPWIFQQTELPPIKLEVTEYRCFRAVCRDCNSREAALPPSGIEPSAFGPRLSAAVTMLTGTYHMGKRKAQGLLSSLLGTQISLGSISNIEGRMVHGLKETQEEIREKVIEGKEPKCIDETSWRQEASRRTAWIVSTAQGAYYSILSSRGKKAFKKIVRRKLQTPVTTDRYAVYQFRRHQWCLAHIQRDLRPLVIWRKICLQTWSDRGSQFIKRIMSAHMMLKRQGKCVLTFLSSIYAGRIDPNVRPSIF